MIDCEILAITVADTTMVALPLPAKLKLLKYAVITITNNNVSFDIFLRFITPLYRAIPIPKNG